LKDLLEHCITACNNSKISFCKFISANDAGATGAHQSGLYIPQSAYNILFNEKGIKGQNKDKTVIILWQNDFETESRFIYYGQGTRNEYRITRFGKGFPYLKDEFVGSLFVICKIEEDFYNAYILESDEDIEDFLSAYSMTANETNQIIPTTNKISPDKPLQLNINELFNTYAANLKIDFPSTEEISKVSREIYYKINNIERNHYNNATINPDTELLHWLKYEFDLFKTIENSRYLSIIDQKIQSVDDLIQIANTILNRRKSRAGKSLENHLKEIFTLNNLKFDHQPYSEDKKKPDFLFPGQKYYFDENFINKNVFLAAKTTCKDRWRQILNEADRIKVKHLFTLQQGISSFQLKEMYDNNVILVIPSEYLNYFPKSYKDKLLTLKGFIQFVNEKCQF